jgi:hypothetical protein
MPPGNGAFAVMLKEPRGKSEIAYLPFLSETVDLSATVIAAVDKVPRGYLTVPRNEILSRLLPDRAVLNVRDILNICRLLIFLLAGMFSSVCTAFLTELFC